MSNVYVSEPATRGKVVLTTTLGDIDIELWTKEAPKACRNFIQLCLEGYYDGCIFHRVVRNFIAQTGDPTGTGTGGESIYGEPFIDEFHQRLRFRHRGLVAMANLTGEDEKPIRNSNGSQFFITLSNCEELNGKNTIFGKITGNTIFNVLKMNDLEVDSEERPTHPPKILSAEVLSSPFDDIIPRDLPKKKQEAEKKTDDRPEIRKTKNLSLLSFEEGEEPEEAPKPKMRSSHIVEEEPAKSATGEKTTQEEKAGDKRKRTDDDQESERRDRDGDRTSKEKKHDKHKNDKDKKQDKGKEKDKDTEDKDGKDKEGKKSKKDKKKAKLRKKDKTILEEAAEDNDEEKTDKSDTGKKEAKDVDEKDVSFATFDAYETTMQRREKEKAKLREEQKKLKRSILSYKKGKTEAPVEDKADYVSPYEQQRRKYVQMQNKNPADRRAKTLDGLERFKQSLRKKEAKEDEDDWKHHELKFPKLPGHEERAEEIYSVFDPLDGKQDKNAPSKHKQRITPRAQAPDRW